MGKVNLPVHDASGKPTGELVLFEFTGDIPDAMTDEEGWAAFQISKPHDAAMVEAQAMEAVRPGQMRSIPIPGILANREVLVPFSKPHRPPPGGTGVGLPLEMTETPEATWEAAREQPGQVITQQQVEARDPAADPRTMTSWIEPLTPGQAGEPGGYYGEVQRTAPATTGFMAGVVPGTIAGVASPLYGKGREDIGQKLEHVEQKLASQVKEDQGFWSAWGKNITDDSTEFAEAMEQMGPAMERWYADQAGKPAGEGFVEGLEEGFEFGKAVPEQIYSEFAALTRSPIDYLTTNPIGTLTVLAPIATSLLKGGYLAASYPVMKLIQRSRRIKEGKSAAAASAGAAEAEAAAAGVEAAAAAADPLALPGPSGYPSPEVPKLPRTPLSRDDALAVTRAEMREKMRARGVELSPRHFEHASSWSEQQAAMERALFEEFAQAHPPQGGITGRLDSWITSQRMAELTRGARKPTQPIPEGAPAYPSFMVPLEEEFALKGVQGKQAAALSLEARSATPAQLAEHFGTSVKSVVPHLQKVRQLYAKDLARKAQKAGSLEVTPLAERDYSRISEAIQEKARVYPPGGQRPAVTPPEPVSPPKAPPVVQNWRGPKHPERPAKPGPGEGKFVRPALEAEEPWGGSQAAVGTLDDAVRRASSARSARAASAGASEAAAAAPVEAVGLGVEVVEAGKHAVTRPKRLQYGLDVEIHGAEAVSEWVDDAIRSGYTSNEGRSIARIKAEEILANPRPLNKVEEVGFAARRHQMERSYEHFSKEIESAKRAGAEAAEIERLTVLQEAALAEFDVITRASEIGGSEWGRAGVARQRDMRFDYSKAAIVRKAKEAKKVPLTPEETAVFHKMSEKMHPLLEGIKALKTKRAEYAEALEAIQDGVKTGSASRVKQLEGKISAIDGKMAKAQAELAKLETRLGIDLTKLLPPGEMALKIAFGLTEAFKTLSASIDLSAMGRQAANVTFNPRRIKMTTKATTDSIKMWKDPEFYQRTVNHLKESAEGKALADKGLVFTDIGGRHVYSPKDWGRINNAEEAIRSPIGEVFQAITPADIAGASTSRAAQEASKLLAGGLNTWGSLITGSNRAYTGYLNSIRYTLAKQLLQMDRKGVSPLSLNDQFFLIDHVNKMTGRGTLFGAETTYTGRGALNTANLLLFAPQLKLAQVQSPLKFLDMGGKFGKGSARARALVARDIAEPVITRLALMRLAELGGADVGWNLDDGTRWGKIGYQVGSWNTAVDLWGGANSPYRLLLETIFQGGRYTRKGDFLPYGEGTGAGKEFFGTALRYWMAPGPGALTNILFMEDVFGYAPQNKALHVAENIGGLAVTIFAANAVEMMVHGYLEEGLPGLGMGAALSAVEFFGGTTSADFTRRPHVRALESLDLLSVPEPREELHKKVPVERHEERTY